MTHFAGLRYTNWMRFRGEHELKLGPGCYAVFAEHENDRHRSNYLGKSSWLAGVRWLLEGVHVEGVDQLDQLISWGEDEVTIDGELTDGTWISRSKKRGKSTSLLLERDDCGQVLKLAGDEAQAEIERIVGIDAEDRLKTCWSEQKDLDWLVSAKTKPSDLTKMIDRWLELEKLVEAGEAVAGWLGSHIDEHKAAVDELARTEERAAPAAIEALEKRVAELEKECDAHDVRAKVRQAEREAYGARLGLLELDEQIASLEAQSRSAPTEKRETVDYTVQVADARTKEAAAKGELERARGEVRRLKVLASGAFDGACPVSDGFACPATAAINGRRSENRKALESAEGVERTKRGNLEVLAAAARGVEARAAEQRRQAEAAREAEIAREADRRRLAALKSQAAAARAKGVEPLARDADGDVEPQPEAIPPRDRVDLHLARRELAERRAAAATLQETRQHAADTAVKVRAHRLASALLGPEGARRRAAERAVATIERMANHDLAKAGIQLTVRAAWGRETGKLAEQCAECAAAFPRSAGVKRCERCGAPRGMKVKHEFRWRLSNTSGAARDLCGLALRCAGFAWLREKRNIGWSVMALDEVTGQLDRAHRVAVSASIRRLLVGSCEQAFLTAHEPGTLDACDRRLLITGSGDWSSIRVAA